MLHAVVEFARTRAMTAEAGFKPKIVRWLLLFSPKGEFLGVHDYQDKANKIKGREFPFCPDLTQPEMVAAGEGCRPFLVDGLDVLCNWHKPDADESTKENLTAKHAYSIRWMTEIDVIPELRLVGEKLNDPVICATIVAEMQSRGAKSTELGTIAIQDGSKLRICVSADNWHDWWRKVRQSLRTARQKKSTKKAKASDLNSMRCLLSGELTSPQATHGKIGGLSGVGGLAMGDAVTSFDKDAFCSYGLEQGANAAMSEQMAATYVAALNRLIKEKSVQLAGTKVLYWYSHELPPEEDIVSELFNFGEASVLEDASGPDVPSEKTILQSETRAQKLLNSIRSGDDPDNLHSVGYCAITLSGNSGRVMIRDWMEGKFEDLASAIAEWFEDLEIVSRAGDAILRHQKFAAVLAASVRDLKDVPSATVSALWRCALLGRSSPIPIAVAAQTLRRVTLDVITDQPARHARIALLKAFLIRSRRNIQMTSELNPLETDPAYLSGRAMALLGRIQYEALGDVGAGVVQRYYAAASATPALVLGRLMRLAQTAHLPRIANPGLRIWFDKQLAEVWNAMTSPPPSVMTLEQQTMFAMGYYHQMAQRGSGKKESTSAATE